MLYRPLEPSDQARGLLSLLSDRKQTQATLASAMGTVPAQIPAVDTGVAAVGICGLLGWGGVLDCHD